MDSPEIKMILEQTSRNLIEASRRIINMKISQLEQEFTILHSELERVLSQDALHSLEVTIQNDRARTKSKMQKTKSRKLHHLRSQTSGSNSPTRAELITSTDDSPTLTTSSTTLDEAETVPTRDLREAATDVPSKPVPAVQDDGCHAVTAGKESDTPDIEQKNPGNVHEDGESQAEPRSVGPKRAGLNSTVVEVVNMSSRKLTTDESSVLSRGLNFVPAKRQTIAHLTAELKQWERLMRLREYWSARPDEPNATGTASADPDSKFKTSTWTPPKGRDPCLDMYLEEVTSSSIRDVSRRGRHNLTPGEEAALTALVKDDSIIIRPADKGSAIVILNREDYMGNSGRRYRTLIRMLKLPETARHRFTKKCGS